MILNSLVKKHRFISKENTRYKNGKFVIFLRKTQMNALNLRNYLQESDRKIKIQVDKAIQK